MKWDQIADDKTIEKTAQALRANSINTFVVDTGKEAKAKVLEMLPKGADVMNMTSITLDTIGVAKEILESGKYKSVREKMKTVDRKTHPLEMQKLWTAPGWTVGSIHAVTEEGQLLIASFTGSQLAAYVFGSPHVVFVVGAQKIVKNVDEGIKRIYDYALPLESERAKKAYGSSGSAVNKLLIINGELQLNRISLILVKEKLGF